MGLHVLGFESVDPSQAIVVVKSDNPKPQEAMEELRGPDATKLAIKAAADAGVTRAQLDPVSRNNAPYAVDLDGKEREEPIPFDQVSEYRARLRVQAGFI